MTGSENDSNGNSSGRPAAATLWLDERGLPVLREQVVPFPGGRCW
jgi:hypothetical protein